MNKIELTGTVKKFPGKNGWYYIPLKEELSQDIREIVRSKWPALLGADLMVNNTAWSSSIMPIKNGPLFIALPKKVRHAENIDTGDKITVSAVLKT